MTYKTLIAIPDHARTLRQRLIHQIRTVTAFPGKRRAAAGSELQRLAEQDVRNRERWIAWSNRWYWTTGRIAVPPRWILHRDE